MNIPVVRVPNRIKFLMRYGVAGALGGLSQLGMVYLLVELFHLWYMIGVVLGFFVALAVSFTLQKYWTFREPSTEHAKRQFVWYTLIALGSLGGNIVLMYMFVERVGMWYLLAQAFTIAIVAGSGFLLNNYITFKHSAESL